MVTHQPIQEVTKITYKSFIAASENMKRPNCIFCGSNEIIWPNVLDYRAGETSMFAEGFLKKHRCLSIFLQLYSILKFESQLACCNASQAFSNNSIWCTTLCCTLAQLKGTTSWSQAFLTASSLKCLFGNLSVCQNKNLDLRDYRTTKKI